MEGSEEYQDDIDEFIKKHIDAEEEAREKEELQNIPGNKSKGEIASQEMVKPGSGLQK